jgi:hypothetical protein
MRFVCFFINLNMQSSAGIGLVTQSSDTLLTLGGCTEKHRRHGSGQAYECVGGVSMAYIQYIWSVIYAYICIYMYVYIWTIV